MSLSIAPFFSINRSSSLQLKQSMTQINYIPFDIIRLIIIRVVSPSVKSLDNWANCIKVLAVSRMWRMIGEPMLYTNIVISLETYHNNMVTVHSNLELVLSNSFENNVCATVVHISPNMTIHEAMAALFWHMPNNLTTTLNEQDITRRFWRIIQTPAFLISGASIEPLLLAMSNLRYLFVESHFMSDPWVEPISTFFHYSVARQFIYRNDVSTFNEHTEFDFVTSFNPETMPSLNIQTSMTRMILGTSGGEQTPASTNRGRIVPSDDRVQLCAEYIRRLRILDLPQSALSSDSSVDVLRDRNPCSSRESFMRRLWFNIRYRSFLSVPNIWFENFTGSVTRYDLFAFNRHANDHMLQISANMPVEISDYVQLLDNNLDGASFGSDSDDN